VLIGEWFEVGRYKIWPVTIIFPIVGFLMANSYYFSNFYSWRSQFCSLFTLATPSPPLRSSSLTNPAFVCLCTRRHYEKKSTSVNRVWLNSWLVVSRLHGESGTGARGVMGREKNERGRLPIPLPITPCSPPRSPVPRASWRRLGTSQGWNRRKAEYVRKNNEHTITAVDLRSHGYPAIPSSWMNTNVHGVELFDKIVVDNRVPVAVSPENLLEEYNLSINDRHLIQE